jgi:hypothetical protein
MTQFARAIEQAGGHAVVRSTPGIGHNYRLKEQEEAVNWLQQFARKRPDRFRFVADTDEHRGIWGIRMTRDLAASALPRFTCAIEGRVVRIETEGTPHIDVFPGTNGLNLTGEINVLVNGEERFAGPVTSAVLRLDIPAK